MNNTEHQKFCPIALSLRGQFNATVKPYCSCESHIYSTKTQQIIEEKNEKKIYKVFRCRECPGIVAVPIEFRGEIACEHDKLSTGSIKDLIDICYL